MVTWPPAAEAKGQAGSSFRVHPSSVHCLRNWTYLARRSRTKPSGYCWASTLRDWAIKFFFNFPDKKLFYMIFLEWCYWWDSALFWLGAQLLGEGHLGHCTALGPLSRSAGAAIKCHLRWVQHRKAINGFGWDWIVRFSNWLHRVGWGTWLGIHHPPENQNSLLATSSVFLRN